LAENPGSVHAERILLSSEVLWLLFSLLVFAVPWLAQRLGCGTRKDRLVLRSAQVGVFDAADLTQASQVRTFPG